MCWIFFIIIFDDTLTCNDIHNGVTSRFIFLKDQSMMNWEMVSCRFIYYLVYDWMVMQRWKFTWCDPIQMSCKDERWPDMTPYRCHKILVYPCNKIKEKRYKKHLILTQLLQVAFYVQEFYHSTKIFCKVSPVTVPWRMPMQAQVFYFDKSNITGVTTGAEPAYPSWGHPRFFGVCVA